jgi:chromosome segregation protein
VYLKKLELVGFKSFPEKTQFIFNDGITGIVGPNGCGKSNLLDALRWVLGEQKTSLLRGTKMEEVIFAGTRTLKPLGMSEVSLHIENRSGILPSQYHELSITRRLFRSGESEYLLNKVPCRLKDITELFADTGMGSHAYAIIQQDMVDAILSDRTEDRRFLFEEAAGITKYKLRRVAAERKLEATENDLLRLQDILAEVTTQANSLKRQVSKAERYKTVSDELKRWQLYLARVKYLELVERHKETAIQIKALSDQKMGFDSSLDGRFAEVETLRTSLADLDHQLSEVGNRILEMSDQAHQLETGISVSREKQDNLRRTASQGRDEIDALSKRSAAIQDEKSRCQTDKDRLAEEIVQAARRLEEAREKQRLADAAYLEFRAHTENENSRLLELQGKISSGKNDSANIEEQIRDLQTETERQNERKTGLNEEKRRRRQEIIAVQEQVEAARREVAEKEATLAAKEKELEDAAAYSEKLRDQLTELTSSYEANAARKNLLSEMVEHYEGYGSGVVAIFEVAGRWLDITGSVADYIRPREGFQTAIEAALGESAQYILCQTQGTAKEAVEYLRSRRAGRAAFLILDKLVELAGLNDLPSIPGVIGRADTLVECDERYRLVPSTLLSRTIVCEHGDAAWAVLEQLPDGYRAVTLTGELYLKNGLVAGGASEEISLIGRKNEIELLGQKLAEMDNQITQVRHRQSEVTLSIAGLRQAAGQLTQNIADDRDRVSDMVSKLKEEQFKINAADEITTNIELQISQLSGRLERLKQRQYTLGLDFDQLDREKANMATLVETKKAQLAELEQAAQAADDLVNQTQMQTIEMESKLSNLSSQLDYFGEMLADIAANIQMKEQQISDAERESQELAAKLVADEVALKEQFDRRQAQLESQRELHQRRDDLSTQIDVAEEQVKKLRREREQIADQIHQAEITMAEINSRLEQVSEHARTELECVIAEIEVESPDPTMTHEMAAAQMEELRDKIRKMGDVNLLALEEYRQQKERQDFLSRQLDDLITAKATLKSTIQKINITARNMFNETMDKARANFKQMYQELFTGGEADVYLENPDDPLESRIEVVSRPRGKKPLTIAQLSGGEKALTAIALLFALYMVKPSPFCFLDEIDAPLDDINVGRFLKIVRTFAKQTQFIIITHNKITMEASDTLYGVTMEEPGVSKVVAVRFKQQGEDADETILEMHYSEDNVTNSN